LAFAVAVAITLPMTTPDPVTAAAGIMNLPRSVRSVGMGESGISDRTDPGNAYLNPANITAVNGFYSTGSYGLAFPTLNTDNSLGHLRLGFGKSLDHEKPFLVAFDLTYARLKYAEKHHEDYIALTAGMNVEVGEHTELALGLAFKHWWEKVEYERTIWLPDGAISDRESSANLFDVGAVVTVNLETSGWRVRPMAGISLVNMGPDIKREGSTRSLPPPSWFKYGVTAHVESPHVTLGRASVPKMMATLNFQGNHGLEEQKPYWGVGAEVAVVQSIFVRWGRGMDDYSHEPISMWGAAFGIPRERTLLRIEYSNTKRPGGWFAYNVDRFGFTFVYLFDGE
jgi:hypothetical protein